MTCPCIPPQTPPVATSAMTLTDFINLVLNMKSKSPFNQIWIGSIRQYTPDVRAYNPTTAQVNLLAPLMRREWAAHVYQGYISNQIINQQTPANLQTVLTVGLASATLVRLSSFQRQTWNFEKHFPVQYIQII